MFSSFLFDWNEVAEHVMCLHVKENEVVVLNELRLLQRVIEELEMSVVSNCLECIRMGRGSRYVRPDYGVSFLLNE